MKKVSKKKSDQDWIKITYDSKKYNPIIFLNDNGDILIKGKINDKEFLKAVKDFFTQLETGYYI